MDDNGGIAIVGMAGRFPGAINIHQFWDHIKAGRECVSQFTVDELRNEGILEHILENPNYIRTKGYVEHADCFDADFFKYTTKEAEMMDPQQRVLLETSYEALEDAGCNPDCFIGDIGVFASTSNNTYLMGRRDNDLASDNQDFFQWSIANGSDFLATRIAYKLNLKGPAQTIQTACSSSLVAVHYACQSLLNYECDAALAGGVSITVPLRSGYMYKKEGIGSPDGHCRPFDTKAAGTVPGNGVAVVILKRLPDALKDQDRIYAVIKGSAINNDGSSKVGFTAPSITGQAKAINTALSMTGFESESISYIETHGTGTKIGDPIEIAGLCKAFEDSKVQQHCAIGALKANIGHLDAAAGVAGLVKTALCLFHKTLPPLANFSSLNPSIELENTPFYINTSCRVWERTRYPRRAGVSAFGIGGTNAHVVLEEYEYTKKIIALSNEWYVLPLSAHTPEALEEYKRRIILHVSGLKITELANAAYTLQTGRRVFAHRAVIIARVIGQSIETQCINYNSALPADMSVEAACYLKAFLNGDALASMLDGQQFTKISLPTYPFARRRYWVEAKKAKASPQPEIAKNSTALAGDVESKILGIVSQLTGENISNKTSALSDLGVDSLLAIDLIIKLEEEFGYNFSAADLEKYPSVSTLSDFINTRLLPTISPQNNKILPFVPNPIITQRADVLLRRGKHGMPTLFLVHPAGGSLAVFNDLVQLIREDIAVVGLRSVPHLNNADVHAMAEGYYQSIRSIQPDGPYLLCGSSLGGAIVYEIAKLLDKDGLCVDLAAMIDTPSPDTSYNELPDSDAEIEKYIRNQSAQFANELSDLHKNNKSDFLRMWRLHRDACTQYETIPHDIKLTYFRAKENTVALGSNFSIGWMAYAIGGIEMYDVAGNHLTMHHMPHVKRIADVLNDKINFAMLQNYFSGQHALFSRRVHHAQ